MSSTRCGAESSSPRSYSYVLSLLAVELNGALSNPLVRGKPLELGRLAALKRKLLARETPQEGSPRRLARRQGSVLAALTRVLELAGKPMEVSEIHRAVEHILDVQVPQSTVKDALSAHTVGGDRRFRRIRYGIYELQPRR